MSKTVTEPAPPKKRRIVRHAKADRYRHVDPETGRFLNGGRGKPRPSRQVPADQRKDYKLGIRIPNDMGEALEAILKQTGESKTTLLTRILKEWLQNHTDSKLE